jgi:hypothetical protein
MTAPLIVENQLVDWKLWGFQESRGAEIAVTFFSDGTLGAAVMLFIVVPDSRIIETTIAVPSLASISAQPGWLHVGEGSDSCQSSKQVNGSLPTALWSSKGKK